ncbi:transcriptional regulator swi6 [Rhizophlyctis rosea]|nr:transcriptional regulator swi6 [Rhizophlyctis rosea]
MSTSYQEQSVFEPNYLASLIDEDEKLADPAQLLLPTPPQTDGPVYPTALIPPTGNPYQPWDDPRYALTNMQSYPSQMYQYTQSQQSAAQMYRTPATSTNSTQSLEAPLPTPLTTQIQHTVSPQQVYPHTPPVAAMQYHQNVYQTPVVPVYKPSNFMTVPLRRQPSEAVEYDRGSHTPPSKRANLSAPSTISQHHQHNHHPYSNNGTSSSSSAHTATTTTSSQSTTKNGTPKVGLYEATYSNVSVYELNVNGVGVMRRQNDSWINATHILKVAGIEKGRRTKILEREIHNGEHEKIQGGYGKYQGTWIPLERAKKLAREYGVGDGLAPLLDL